MVDYTDELNKTEAEFSLPKGLIHAVAGAESGGAADAGTAQSAAGAYGPMQLRAGAAQDMGVNRYVPEENIRGGGKYLRQNLDEFGNTRDALIAYNWGPRHAREWLARGGNMNELPKETYDYVTSRVKYNQDDAQGAEQGTPEAGPELADRKVQYHGVNIPVSVPANWTDEQTIDWLHGDGKDAIAEDRLAMHATEQGKHYNFQTGEITDYGNWDKFQIGIAHTAAQTRGGASQLFHQLTGNIEAAKQDKEQTAAEQELFDHLDDTGIGAEDFGQIAATVPLMFGPGGILRNAAQAGVFETLQPADTVGGHAWNGAKAAGSVALVGGAGLGLYTVATKMGVGNTAAWIGGVLADATYGLPIATVGNVARMAYKMWQKNGEASSEVTAKLLQQVDKAAKDPVVTKLSKMKLELQGSPAEARLSEIIKARIAAQIAKDASAERQAADAVAEAHNKKLTDAIPAAPKIAPYKSVNENLQPPEPNPLAKDLPNSPDPLWKQGRGRGEVTSIQAQIDDLANQFVAPADRADYIASFGIPNTNVPAWKQK